MVRYRSFWRATWHLSWLKDLSVGGARFLGEDRLEQGEPLELRIGLPVLAQPATLTARVVWQRPLVTGKLRLATTGIAFTRLPRDINREIAGAVWRLSEP